MCNILVHEEYKNEFSMHMPMFEIDVNKLWFLLIWKLPVTLSFNLDVDWEITDGI
jgi:hypothetical protein